MYDSDLLFDYYKLCIEDEVISVCAFFGLS